jgi:hypothetical protein
MSAEVVMYTLAPDEKLTKVMMYSHNKLMHGDLVTKQNLRVNLWLRTQGVPNFIHLLNPELLVFSGSAPKSMKFNEYFFPTERVIGFHIAPPATEPLDYDETEKNRMMADVQLILGPFNLKGKVRISTQTDFATSIEVSRMSWFSVYEADISNPFLPSMPVIHVPMLLVNPLRVSFAI